MPEPLTCHLQICIGIDHPGAAIVVSDMNELGGRR
jgi:hypothetical protein